MRCSHDQTIRGRGAHPRDAPPFVLHGHRKEGLSAFPGFDAASGRAVLKKDLGDSVDGRIVTYMLGGIQYVAVAGATKNPVIRPDSRPAWVAILALPDRAGQ